MTARETTAALGADSDGRNDDSLLNEWLALPDPGETARVRLAALGISFKAALACGGVAVARIGTAGKMWHPEPEGQPHMVLPIFAGDIPSPGCAVADDDLDLVDLLAFRTDQPERWYWRRGECAVPLGAARIDDAHGEASPARLFPTPLDWLRAGGEGAVILDWHTGISRLWGLSDVQCDGPPSFGHFVARQLRQPAPRVLIPAQEETAA